MLRRIVYSRWKYSESSSAAKWSLGQQAMGKAGELVTVTAIPPPPGVAVKSKEIWGGLLDFIDCIRRLWMASVQSPVRSGEATDPAADPATDPAADPAAESETVVAETASFPVSGDDVVPPASSELGEAESETGVSRAGEGMPVTTPRVSRETRSSWSFHMVSHCMAMVPLEADGGLQ